jgi:hypothetical protein
MKAILVLAGGGARLDATLATALLAARRLDARLTALHVRPDADLLAFYAGDTPGRGAPITWSEAFVAERESRARAVFDKVLGGESARATWRVEGGRESELLVRIGRVSDLLVIGRAGDEDGAPGSVGSALFETGRPVLVAPPAPPPSIGTRVAIAWNGSVQAARAIGAAVRLIAPASEGGGRRYIDNSRLEPFTIRLTISGVEEICRTLSWREILETGGDDCPQVLDRTGGRFAKDRFELGEELLDRIEVRTVRREVEKSRFARLDSLAHARNLVNADVVHDDDVAALESWSKDLFDVGHEAPAIHRPIQQQGRRDAIVAQRRNEGRRFPMAKRYLADEPFTARSATVATGHVCGCAGFIDEHQLSRIKPGLHLAPCLTRRGDVRPVLFGRVQAFF